MNIKAITIIILFQNYLFILAYHYIYRTTIFVALVSSHQTLYEWLDICGQNGEIISGEIKKYEQGRGIIYRYK